MWQTKYASAVPKNLGLGLDFRPYSEGYFLTGGPQSVVPTIPFIIKVFTCLFHNLGRFKPCILQSTKQVVFYPYNLQMKVLVLDHCCPDSLRYPAMYSLAQLEASHTLKLLSKANNKLSTLKYFLCFTVQFQNGLGMQVVKVIGVFKYPLFFCLLVVQQLSQSRDSVVLV